jgi:hypothetical protein
MVILKPELAIVIAYVDPGSGFLMLQMIGGAALGAWFYFRRSVARFVARALGRPQLERDQESTAEASAPASDSH